MQQSRFLPNPKPNSEVVDLLERALESAKNGHVRTMALIVVNPAHQVETASVGDLSEVRTTVLLGGLSRATHDLLRRK